MSSVDRLFLFHVDYIYLVVNYKLLHLKKNHVENYFPVSLLRSKDFFL